MDSERTQIVPIEGAPEHAPRSLRTGYYRCEQPHAPYAPGDRVLVNRIDDKYVWVRTSRGSSTGILHDQFRREFVYLGEQVDITADVAAKIAEINALTAQANEVGAALEGFRPHVEADGISTGTGLVRVQSQADLKHEVAIRRNAVLKIQNNLTTKQQELATLLEEQSALMLGKVSELQALVQKAEEVIWTINLYLGKNEEIFTLVNGAPAPDDTPITVRQLVLYMDEECAVAAEEGGIDAVSIEAFDKWLLEKPEHLAQILPETKGMVALKPRRHRKDYGDPWANQAMDEANKKTYFLLRNGGNLYRMWTDFEVGTTLIPRKDEFDRYFEKTEYVRTDRGLGTERVTRRMTPGSDEYMQAEKNAGSAQRHYLRVGLILQGLIDRTPIFRPLAWPVSITNTDDYPDKIRFINDADLALGDGHERWDDWFDRVNSQIGVGVRITGYFDGLWNEEGRNRLSPKGASPPPSMEIYTLEERRERGFAFYYRRSDKRYGYVPDPDDPGWNRWDQQEYKNRAACTVYPDDRFILNIDAVEIADMEYFLHCRLDRRNYSGMFPILKRAIAIKKKEAEEEAPFRQLLVGEIVKAYGVRFDDAEEKIDPLIYWWKFKNKHHRALLSDDRQALDMIVEEFGRRAEEDAKRARLKRSGHYDAVTRAIVAASLQTPLIIAHRKDNEFVSLVPENDEHVFVAERIWRVKKNALELKEERRWRIVDGRMLRWDIIARDNQRLKKWQVNASVQEHLTDPERETLLAEGLALMEEQSKDRKIYRRDDADEESRRFWPLMAEIEKDDDGKEKISVWYSPLGPDIPADNRLLTESISEPSIARQSIKFHRQPDRTPQIRLGYGGHGAYLVSVLQDFDCPGREVFKRWPENIDRVKAEIALVAEASERKRALESVVSIANFNARVEVTRRRERAAYEEFLAEHGDPELWEGHKKTLRQPQETGVTRGLEEVLSVLVERGIEIEGRTVADCWKQWQGLTGQTSIRIRGYRSPGDPDHFTLNDAVMDITLKTGAYDRS